MPRFDFGRIKPDAPLTYLLPILGVMLLVLIWTALIDYLEREHDVAVRNTIADTEGNARAFANHTEQVLRHIDQVTRLVQFEFEKTRGRGDTFDFEATIRRAVVSFKGLVLVALLDKQGNGISVSSDRPGWSSLSTNHFNVADTEPFHFRIHRERPDAGLYVGRPEPDPSTGKNVITVTRRLNGRDASFGGVVAVAVDPTVFSDFYDIAGLGSNGIVAVFGRDGGARVLRNGKGSVPAAGVVVDTTAGTIDRGPNVTGPITDPVDHVRRYVGTHAVADYPLQVRVGTAESDMLAGYEREKNRYLMYALGLSIVIIGGFTTVIIMVFRLRKTHREAETNRATYKAATEGSLDAFLLLKWRRAAHDCPEGFIVADANRRAFALLKLRAKDVLGKRFTDLLPEPQHLHQLHFDAITAGTSLEEELEISFGRRPMRWFRHQVVPLEDGAAVTLRDIDCIEQGENRCLFLRTERGASGGAH